MNVPEYVGTWKERRSQMSAFLRAFKGAVGCKDCGTTEGRLAFDHRPGAIKIGNVGDLVNSLSWATLIAEIDKCDVRCGPCHILRHYKEDLGRREYISRCRSRDFDIDRAIRLRQTGMSFRKLADEIGVPKSVIARRLKKEMAA